MDIARQTMKTCNHISQRSQGSESKDTNNSDNKYSNCGAQDTALVPVAMSVSRCSIHVLVGRHDTLYTGRVAVCYQAGSQGPTLSLFCGLSFSCMWELSKR